VKQTIDCAVSALNLELKHTRGATGGFFGLPMPKRHVEAGRVSLFKGYFYFTDVAGLSQGAEAGYGPKEEEASGAYWEAEHHFWKRHQSLSTARGQTQSQPASMLGRVDGARQQAPSTWRFVRASARELISHGRQAVVGSRQPRPSGGGATYAAVLAGPVAPSRPSGTLKPTAMDSDPSESSVSSRKQTGTCLATFPGL